MPRETAATPLFCLRALAVSDMMEGMRNKKRSTATTM